MLAATSFLECAVYVGLFAILIWLMDVVDPWISRLFRMLGKGVGHLFDRGAASNEAGVAAEEKAVLQKEAKEYAQHWQLFFTACLAKFAKIDGVVTKNELAVIEEIFGYMDMDAARRRQAIDVFKHAKQGRATLRACVRQCVEWQQGDTQWALALMILFFKVAHADGAPNALTRRALEDVCGWAGLSYAECAKAYANSRQGNSQPSDKVGAAYEVLGCKPSDALNVIKDRYRKLVKDFHPDTVMSKGLPADFVRFAEERFKQIQAAYETIMQARGATAA